MSNNTAIVRLRQQLESQPLNGRSFNFIYDNYWVGRPERQDFLKEAKDWAIERILFWGQPLCGEGRNHQIPDEDLLSALVVDAEERGLRKSDRSVVWRDVMSRKSWHDSPIQFSNRLARRLHDQLLIEAIEQLKEDGALSRPESSRGAVWVLSPRPVRPSSSSPRSVGESGAPPDLPLAQSAA